MQKVEINEFEKHIKAANVYFEWGCGGSTVAACADGQRKVISVDSTKEWIEHVRAVVKDQTNVTLLLVDLDGDSKNWGWPSEARRQEWPLYAKAILDIDVCPDLVLIDGRFRVACALCALNKISERTTVLIHDYSFRPQYHVIEEFYDRVGLVESLGVFKRKPTVDWNRVSELLPNYLYSPQ